MNKLFLTLPLLSMSLSSYAFAKRDSNADLSSRIRRSVDEDSSLSPEARDVKISAHNGFVTLRGPVKTNIERLIVGEKAKDFAGDKKVKNELRVEK